MALDRTRLIVSHDQPAYIFLLLFATVHFQSQWFSSSERYLSEASYESLGNERTALVLTHSTG